MLNLIRIPRIGRSSPRSASKDLKVLREQQVRRDHRDRKEYLDRRGLKARTARQALLELWVLGALKDL
jgi:hypothetical protein